MIVSVTTKVPLNYKYLLHPTPPPIGIDRLPCDGIVISLYYWKVAGNQNMW